MCMSEPNLTKRLFGALWAKSQVSAKARERFTSLNEAYFHYKGELENKCIFSGDLFELFEKATVNEIKELSLDCDSAPDFLNSFTLYFILNDTLARLIDAEREKEEKTHVLLSKYREIQQRYPECADSEDLFTKYLATRQQRKLAENYKLTGEGCPYCLGTHIQSYGDKYRCVDCKHYWRKH